MEKVAFIILTYKNIVDTIECVQSIKSTILNNYEKMIFVVDNSEDETYINEIKKDESLFCYSVKNEGYSSGNNFGIRKAIEKGCSYFILINNDTIVTEDFAEKLLRFLETNDYSIVSPIILSYWDKKVWYSGGKYRKLLCDYSMSSKKIKTTKKTEFITGCCLATTKKVFDRIGLLKEDYFMYNEDAEFSHRAKRNKVGLYVLPDSVIYHKISRSSAPNSPFQLYYIFRNRIKFAREEIKGCLRIYAVFINLIKAHYKTLCFKAKKKPDESFAIKNAIKDSKRVCGRFRY